MTAYTASLTLLRRAAGIAASAALAACVPEVIVEPPQVASVSVSLATTTIMVGATTQATASAMDTRGLSLSSELRTWTSSAPLIASVSGSGLVTGVAPGTATIRGTVMGRTGSVDVTVLAPVASVQVSGAGGVSTVQRGNTLQLTATLRDAGGAILTGRSVTWTSSNAAFASVSASGLVTGTGTGSATITATAEGASGTLQVTVSTDVATVTVTPSSPTIAPVGAVLTGGTQQLTATPRSAAGTALSGRVTTWRSLDTTIAVVDASGLVTAVRPGSVGIEATVEGVTGNASVTVSNCTSVPYVIGTSSGAQSLASTDCIGASDTRNDLYRFSVNTSTMVWWSFQPLTPAGAVLGLFRRVSSSGDRGDLVVAGAQGHTLVGSGTHLFYLSNALAGSTALPVGYTFSTTSAAASGGIGYPSGCTIVPVIVAGGVVATRTLAAGCDVATRYYHRWAIFLGAGESLTAAHTSSAFDAFLELYALGTDGSTTGALLMSDNNSNGGQDARLTYSNSTARWVELRSTSAAAGMTGSYTLSMAIGTTPVASVTVTAPSTSLLASGTLQLTATPRNAANVALTGRTVTWSSSNPAAATVSASGLVSGVGPGSTVITATSEGVSGTLALSVTTDVASVTYAPAGVIGIGVGGTHTLVATPRNASGTALTGRTVTWTSTVPQAATVDASGTVTGLASGSTTVRATVEGVSVSIPVQVVSPACSAVNLNIGTTVSSRLLASDCVVGSFAEDRYQFIGTDTRIVRYQTSTPSASARLWIQMLQSTAVGPANGFSASALDYTVIYGAGTHWWKMVDSTSIGASYTVVTSVGSLGSACGTPHILAIGGGATFSRTVGAGSCLEATSGQRYDRYWIWLNEGQTVTVDMTSTAGGGFDSFLRLRTDFGVPTTVATNDNAAAGTLNARLTFTAPAGGGSYALDAMSNGGVTGLYTLTISTTPASLMSP